jgi:hypothetical protein
VQDNVGTVLFFERLDIPNDRLDAAVLSYIERWRRGSVWRGKSVRILVVRAICRCSGACTKTFIWSCVY